MSVVHLLLPSEAYDNSQPSGGNVYDRRLAEGLAALGVDVRLHKIAGVWPGRLVDVADSLERVIDDAPDGEVLIVDGLVAAAAPELLVRAAGRLRLMLLAHVVREDLGERALAEVAEVVITPSEWARHRLLECYRLPPDRVRVAGPGVDAAPLATGTAEGGNLLCVGAVTPLKGQDVLVAALSRQSSARWICEIVGPLDQDPDFVAQLRARIGEDGLSSRVAFAGVRIGAALADAYAWADLVVVASRSESFGMVVTEALARGLPVLASATGGVPEALGQTSAGRPGLLVAPDDQLALSDALAGWLADSGQRRQLRERAGERRRQLSGWDATARSVARWFTDEPSPAGVRVAKRATGG